MMIAVYIVSHRDRIEKFVSKASGRGFEGRAVYIGNVEDNLRSIVFVDGPPLDLKRKILSGEDAREVLMSFKRHIVSMLKSVNVGQDDLRVFVHFGGQGEDEVKNFNEVLEKVSSDLVAFKCYAISFGNKIPAELFPDGIFTPPHGDIFKKMCLSLQKGEIDSFSHLRSLRLLLSCVIPNKEGIYVLDGVLQELLSLSGRQTVNALFSQPEKRFIVENAKLIKIFNKRFHRTIHRNDLKSIWLSLPCRIDFKEYETLMTELEAKGGKR